MDMASCTLGWVVLILVPIRNYVKNIYAQVSPVLEITSLKILYCRKNVDLSNQVLYILVSQGADKWPDDKS